jgi:hypothetical protein
LLTLLIVGALTVGLVGVIKQLFGASEPPPCAELARRLESGRSSRADAAATKRDVEKLATVSCVDEARAVLARFRRDLDRAAFPIEHEDALRDWADRVEKGLPRR